MSKLVNPKKNDEWYKPKATPKVGGDKKWYRPKPTPKPTPTPKSKPKKKDK